MDKNKLKHFEELLRKERERVLEEIELLRPKVEGEEEEVINYYPTHPADAGIEEEVKVTDTILLDNLSRELREIEAALERIAEGTYGICEKCGKEISEGRLKLIPYTRFCRECAEKEEG